MDIQTAVKTANQTMKDSATALLKALEAKDDKIVSKALKTGATAAFVLDKAGKIAPKIGAYVAASQERDSQKKALEGAVAADDSKAIAESFVKFKSARRRASAYDKVVAALAKIA